MLLVSEPVCAFMEHTHNPLFFFILFPTSTIGFCKVVDYAYSVLYTKKTVINCLCFRNERAEAVCA